MRLVFVCVLFFFKDPNYLKKGIIMTLHAFLSMEVNKFIINTIIKIPKYLGR